MEVKCSFLVGYVTWKWNATFEILIPQEFGPEIIYGDTSMQIND